MFGILLFPLSCTRVITFTLHLDVTTNREGGRGRDASSPKKELSGGFTSVILV